MGAPQPTPGALTVSQQDVHDAYSDLYDNLNQAYWVASTIEDKDRLHGTAETVFEILTALNAADIKSRTDDYAKLTKAVSDVNKKLKAIQEEMDKIIHNLTVAKNMADAITKALSTAKSFGL